MPEEQKCYVCAHLGPDYQSPSYGYAINYALEAIEFRGTVHEHSWIVVKGPALFCPACGRAIVHELKR